MDEQSPFERGQQMMVDIRRRLEPEVFTLLELIQLGKARGIMRSRRVILALCIPLFVPRAKKAVWLNGDLIRLLAGYIM